MSARRQAPTPQGFQRPVTAAAMGGLYLVEVEEGVYRWSTEPAGPLAALAETEPGADVYEITMTPGAAKVARPLRLGFYGVVTR